MYFHFCTKFRAALMAGIAMLSSPMAFGQAPDQRLIGEWLGVVTRDAPHFQARELVDIEIQSAPDGSGLQILDRARASVGMAPGRVTMDGEGRLQASWPGLTGDVAFNGQLSRDGQVLKATLGEEILGSGTKRTVELRHNDRDAQRYLAPRVGPDGKKITTFHYAPPAAFPDGLKVGTAVAAGLAAEPLKAMVREILGQTRDPHANETDSVLIAKDGKLVFEEYFWGYDAAAPHEISSDTKSISSILTGIAVDQGLIKTSDPVWQSFESYAAEPWVEKRYPTTLANLLSMQGNLNWNEDVPYQDERNSTIAMIRADDPLKFMLDQSLDGVPGSTFKYNSGLPLIVGEMVSRAARKPLDEFADSVLFKPMAIVNYEWARLKDGHPLAAGGLRLRPRDMLKIGQMMLDEGVWKGRRIVSEAWVKESTSRQTAPSDYPYGYYWHLSTGPGPWLQGPEAFMAIGQAGQYIIVLPKLKAVAVVTSSNWQPAGTKLALSAIINKFIVPALTGGPATSVEANRPAQQ